MHVECDVRVQICNAELWFLIEGHTARRAVSIRLRLWSSEARRNALAEPVYYRASAPAMTFPKAVLAPGENSGICMIDK